MPTTSEVFVPPALERFRRWRYGAHGLFNATWAAQQKADPLGKSLVMCFDLLFADEVVRLCAGPTGVTSTSGNDGTVYAYRPLLAEEPGFTRSYSLGTASSQASTLSPIAIPGAVFDALAVLRRGRLLSGYGEVSIQWDGMDHDERIVLLRGDMDSGVSGGPSGAYRDSAELVTTAISDPKVTADVNLTPWVVDTDRFANPDSRALGKRYPLVVNAYADVPAVFVDTTTNIDWLVCYGHGFSVSQSTGVKVNGTIVLHTDTAFAWSKVETTDTQGIPITVIRFTGTHTWDGSEAVHVTVTGSVYASDLVGAVRFLAEGFTVLGPSGANAGLYAEAQAKIGAPDVRVLANASGGGAATTALQYIESGLLRGFPQVSMVWSRGGYGPVVTDRRAPVKTSLTAGAYPLAGKALRWSEGPLTDVFNDFVVRYGFNVIDNAYTGVATRNAGNSDLCGLLERWIGKRTMAPIESPYIVTQAVAEQVVDWLVDHLLLPPIYVEYPCLPWLVLQLERGDNVDLTDERFGWSGVRATVRSLRYQRQACTIGLYVWERYYTIGGASSAAFVGSSN